MFAWTSCGCSQVVRGQDSYPVELGAWHHDRIHARETRTLHSIDGEIFYSVLLRYWVRSYIRGGGGIMIDDFTMIRRVPSAPTSWGSIKALYGE